MAKRFVAKQGRICYVSLIEEKPGIGCYRRVRWFHRLLKVTVLGIQGVNVRLGFETEPDIPIHRFEVWERIKAEGQLLHVK